MQFHVTEGGGIAFRKIHPLLAELIRNIPHIVEPSNLSDAAEDRLYPEPSPDPDLDQMRSDWQAFVAPDLQQHFQSTRDIVAADLRRLLQGEDNLFEITIPHQHTEAWLNVLNQVRLAMAADIEIDDEAALEALDADAHDLLTETGITAFRINLYATMQQCLVEFLDSNQ
ncbi:MAG: DUF2017 family protein [Chthoniobacterales bacterium]